MLKGFWVFTTVALACFILFSPVLAEQVPFILLPCEGVEPVKNFLIDRYVSSGFVLSSSTPNSVIVDMPREVMPLGDRFVFNMNNDSLKKSYANYYFLKRINFTIVPQSDVLCKILMQPFRIDNPGTQVEQATDLSQMTERIGEYRQHLVELKEAYEIYKQR